MHDASGHVLVASGVHEVAPVAMTPVAPTGELDAAERAVITTDAGLATAQADA